MPRDVKINLNHWKKLSTRWRDDLQDRIERLERLKNGMDECIGCGCLSIKTCQLVNADDHIGKIGSGPRFLEEDAPKY